VSRRGQQLRREGRVMRAWLTCFALVTLLATARRRRNYEIKVGRARPTARVKGVPTFVGAGKFTDQTWHLTPGGETPITWSHGGALGYDSRARTLRQDGVPPQGPRPPLDGDGRGGGQGRRPLRHPGRGGKVQGMVPGRREGQGRPRREAREAAGLSHLPRRQSDPWVARRTPENGREEACEPG